MILKAIHAALVAFMAVLALALPVQQNEGATHEAHARLEGRQLRWDHMDHCVKQNSRWRSALSKPCDKYEDGYDPWPKADEYNPWDTPMHGTAIKPRARLEARQLRWNHMDHCVKAARRMYWGVGRGGCRKYEDGYDPWLAADEYNPWDAPMHGDGTQKDTRQG